MLMRRQWLYLVQDGGRYYLVLTADEVPPPTISVQHKSHITKVMFLCAVARPRYNNTTRQWFDGLFFGIYPVGEFDLYKRGSRYHARGEIKWTNFGALDREEYQRMMVNLVLPDIKRKMPINNKNIIVLQQDGAKAHLPVVDGDPVFKAKVEEELYHGNENAVTLYTQPAQSPDLNVNDLGFFASLQSMYSKTAPTDALELIDKVETCCGFNNYHVNKLNRIWLTLQSSCMNEIIEEKGDNKYKIPHMNKARLERLNQPAKKGHPLLDYDFWTEVDFHFFGT
jgi:hypothetical protein